MSHSIKIIAAAVILSAGAAGLSTSASAQSMQFDPAVGGCIPMSSGSKCFTFKGNRRIVSLSDYRKAVREQNGANSSNSSNSVSNIVKKYSNMKWNR